MKGSELWPETLNRQTVLSAAKRNWELKPEGPKSDDGMRHEAWGSLQANRTQPMISRSGECCGVHAKKENSFHKPCNVKRENLRPGGGERGWRVEGEARLEGRDGLDQRSSRSAHHRWSLESSTRRQLFVDRDEATCDF